ncbi:secretin receptor-like isoform X2 [Mytilus edulis]|uniref:secretin receptor-like isoform X2 n=1 Tax=Mytilus edulis TaxID=6550 RepID=UPI0039EEFD3A
MRNRMQFRKSHALYVVLMYTMLDNCKVKGSDLLINNEEQQRKVLYLEELQCNKSMQQEKQTEGLYCNITWDGISCWPATKAGTVAVKPCPDYINRLDPTENVTRRCESDGSWFVIADTNKTWSDYSACVMNNIPVNGVPGQPVPAIIKDHMDNLTIMKHTGYGLSLASLLVAVIIMLYFKKLHCPRNTIHLNLFLSFILRAIISFIKNGIMIEGLGFSSDVYYNEKGQLAFLPEGLHWECRMFMTIVNYIMAANYAWIFVEALYLQMLISVAVFTEKKHLHIYMLLGWTFPLVFIIPWVAVRSTVDNKLCWTTYDIRWVEWIIHGPILLTIVINFTIFINIVRVLFTKLNSSPCPETKKFRYRRLAKSTLVLIPLFGVHYMVFSIIFQIVETQSKGLGLLIYFYLEIFFNSYQGFILSLLFCFFNSEVQNEFKKAWRRYTLTRSGSSRWRSTFTSRTKSWKDHRNSDSNGVTSRGDRVRPNERELNSSPTLNITQSPITQSSYAYDVKISHELTGQDIEICENTPWLNNNHTAYVEQHGLPEEHADESL